MQVVSVDAYYAGMIPKVVAGAIPANSLQDLGWWVGFLIARRDSHFGVDTPGSSVSIFDLVH